MNDSNIIENGDVYIKISNPNLIVLPIPEKNTNTFVQFGICITNNRLQDFHLNLYEVFTPVLVTSQGQEIQRQLITDLSLPSIQSNISIFRRWKNIVAELRNSLTSQVQHSSPGEISYLLVPPRDSKSFSLTGNIYWQNNLLIFQISAVPEVFQSPNLPSKFWSFTSLQPATYKLRFIYKSEHQTTDGLKLAKSQEEIRLGQLATQVVNFHLVQHNEPDYSTLVVDGIGFETIVPELVLLAPKKNLVCKFLHIFKSLLIIGRQHPQHPYPYVFNKIGLRIVNNKSIPLRFNFGDILIPELVEADRQILWNGYCIRPEGTLDSDFPLAMPGESLTFFQDITIFWLKDNQFGLSIFAPNGFHWISEPLRLGTYYVRFTYINTMEVVTRYSSINTDTKSGESFWIGQVSTPFVEIRLVSSS
ncbi:MAG: hypothetical protein V7K64_18575 [Nostoc sp.]|uniref:hypothetical protein n=1 Tax=Nostoc sp. TaxID=1180 RepID=UPI002FFCA9AC